MAGRRAALALGLAASLAAALAPRLFGDPALKPVSDERDSSIGSWLNESSQCTMVLVLVPCGRSSREVLFCYSAEETAGKPAAYVSPDGSRRLSAPAVCIQTRKSGHSHFAAAL